MIAHLLVAALPALAPCTPEFGSETRYDSGAFDESVVIADLNADGVPDAVVGLFITQGVNVLYGDGLGGFTPPHTFDAGAGGGVAVGDLNHDGRPDIVTANVLDDDISILLANNDNSFDQVVRIPAGDGPASVVIADFDLDTHPDLAVSAGLDDSLRIFQGDGTGAFSAGQMIVIDDLRQVVTADFNADGVPDLAVPRSSPAKVDVLLGVGDGTFAGPVSFDAGFGAGHIRLADLDADSHTDMVVVHRIVSVPPTDATISVLLGAGDGTFSAPTDYTVGQRSHACAIADFDDDGALDVVVTNIDTSELSLLRGVGDGTLLPQVRMPYADAPTAIASADLVGDGLPDLVFLHNQAGDLSVVMNLCPSPGCNDADLAEPFGTLDFSDVVAFLSAFGAMDPAADLAAPFGTFDFSDVVAFLSAFGAGCP